MGLREIRAANTTGLAVETAAGPDAAFTTTVLVTAADEDVLEALASAAPQGAGSACGPLHYETLTVSGSGLAELDAAFTLTVMAGADEDVPQARASTASPGAGSTSGPPNFETLTVSGSALEEPGTASGTAAAADDNQPLRTAQTALRNSDCSTIGRFPLEPSSAGGCSVLDASDYVQSLVRATPPAQPTDDCSNDGQLLNTLNRLPPATRPNPGDEPAEPTTSFKHGREGRATLNWGERIPIALRDANSIDNSAAAPGSALELPPISDYD